MSDMPRLAAYLTIKDAAAAIDFYKQAFGAEVRELHKTEDGAKIMHADLAVYGRSVMLSDEMPEFPGPIKAPASLGGTTFNLFVELAKPADVDAAMAKAAKAGATVVMPAGDQFWGARFGLLTDPAGHAWAFSAPLAR